MKQGVEIYGNSIARGREIRKAESHNPNLYQRRRAYGFTLEELMQQLQSEIAAKFEEASKHYQNDPVALQLRGMNIGAIGGLSALAEQAKRNSEDD